MEGERGMDVGDGNASLRNTDGGTQRFRCLRNQERFATEYGCGNATFALLTGYGKKKAQPELRLVLDKQIL